MENKPQVDLHCHSHFSDGSCSLLELVNQAVRLGLKALVVTDHDTVASQIPLR